MKIILKFWILTIVSILIFTSQSDAVITKTIFSDNFSDGNYNGWVARWGNHTVVSGALRSTSGHIYATNSPIKNYVLTAQIRTVSPGGQSWQVGRLIFRESDENNFYAVMINNDSTVELAKKQNGTWSPGLAITSTSLNPTSWHTFVVRVEDATINVSVDGTEYISYWDSNPLTNGKIGLQAESSVAEIDDVVVNHETKVLAFYYGWYGDASENWMHWLSPNPVGSTTWYIPTLGVYSSLDNDVISQHVDWAKQAGIDGFIFSWFHKSAELEHFRTALTRLISISQQKDFLVSVLLETEEETTLPDQVNYLIEEGFIDSPIWFYKDGRPVFYVWAGITTLHPGNPDPAQDYWVQIRSQMNRPVYLNLWKMADPYPHTADAIHWFLFRTDDVRTDDEFLHFFNDLNNLFHGPYALPVNPGFNNDLPDINWGSLLIIDRKNGQRYHDQWNSTTSIANVQNYPGYDPDEILITTWNDWHETTAIEPCGEWGTMYLEITSNYTGTVFECPNLPVKVDSTYYSTLQSAYDAAWNGAIIQSQAVDFTENLDIDLSKSVTLEGGYNCDYTSNNGITSIKGETRISSGTLRISSGTLRIAK